MALGSDSDEPVTDLGVRATISVTSSPVAGRPPRTYAKFDFYARHGVEEILVVDPAARQVAVWAGSSDDPYEKVAASAALGLGADDLAAAIVWPAADQ